MAKGGKFTKLMKKLSLRKPTTTQTNTSSADSSVSRSSSLRSYISLFSSIEDISGNGLHEVYVGRSRRQYSVPSDVVENPIFRQLTGESAGAREITVGCEVVLFNHFLWMLENSNPQYEISSSLDELVKYYTY